MIIRNAGQVVLAPAVSVGAGVVVWKKVPDRASETVVFAYGAPLPLGKLRSPAPPVRRALAGLGESLCFLIHGGPSSLKHAVCLFDVAARKRMQRWELFENILAFQESSG